MSHRPTELDKMIKTINDKITALEWVREELLAQQAAGDLAAAKRPSLKTVAK